MTRTIDLGSTEKDAKYCGEDCPHLTKALQNLRHFSGQKTWVSVLSIDPAIDTRKDFCKLFNMVLFHEASSPPCRTWSCGALDDCEEPAIADALASIVERYDRDGGIGITREEMASAIATLLGTNAAEAQQKLDALIRDIMAQPDNPHQVENAIPAEDIPFPS